MATPSQSSISHDLDNNPVIHITYECILHERLRDSASYLYEVACSVTYPVDSSHLSMRVSAQNTYRNTASREIPFTLHKSGATAYVELLESEQLEVRTVELGGDYNKVVFRAQGQEILEQSSRHIASTIHHVSE